jgi:hypothetical protein
MASGDIASPLPMVKRGLLGLFDSPPVKVETRNTEHLHMGLLDSPPYSVQSNGQSIPLVDDTSHPVAVLDCGSASKKLIFDGEKPPVLLPPEVVSIIILIAWSSGLYRASSVVGAVSTQWHYAAEWVKILYAEAPSTISLFAPPSIAMRYIAPYMLDMAAMVNIPNPVVLSMFPHGIPLVSVHLSELLHTYGWLFDETILLICVHVLGMAQLQGAILVAAETLCTTGSLDGWSCPRMLYLEPFIAEAFMNGKHPTHFFSMRTPSFAEALMAVIIGAEMIVAPVCVGKCHWVVIIVFLKAGVVHTYDSLGAAHPSKARNTLHVLDELCQHHINDSLKSVLGIRDWVIHHHQQTAPQQKDHSSCGVFVCVTALYISQALELSFSQEDMHYWRLRFAYELVYHKEANPYPPEQEVIIIAD